LKTKLLEKPPIFPSSNSPVKKMKGDRKGGVPILLDRADSRKEKLKEILHSKTKI